MQDDHFINQEQEHYAFVYPTQWEIHKEMARHIGEANKDQQWVLTGFDVWEKNPFYSGPEQPHPEYDDYPEDTEIPATLTDVNLEDCDISDDECPF